MVDAQIVMHNLGEMQEAFDFWFPLAASIYDAVECPWSGLFPSSSLDWEIIPNHLAPACIIIESHGTMGV
jgi:hypothetical protein